MFSPALSWQTAQVLKSPVTAEPHVAHPTGRHGTVGGREYPAGRKLFALDWIEIMSATATYLPLPPFSLISCNPAMSRSRSILFERSLKRSFSASRAALAAT